MRSFALSMWRPLCALGALTALSVSASFAACTQRRLLTRDELLDGLAAREVQPEVPSLAEIVALRVPEPAAKPASLDAHRPLDDVAVARLAIATGDIEAAESAWQRAALDGRHASAAWADRCLVESALRRSEHVVEACVMHLRTSPGDVRAAAAARALSRSGPVWRPAVEVLAREGMQWVKGCARAQGRCDALAFTVAERSVELSRAGADAARFDDAVRATGRLTRARIEGPYRDELHAAFDADRGGRPLTPWEPHFQTVQAVDDDGLFEPAAPGEPGIYRLVLEGRGGGLATVYARGGEALRVRVDGVVVLERAHDTNAPEVARASVELTPGDHTVEVLAWVSGGEKLSIAVLGSDGEPALAERRVHPDAAPTRLAGRARLVESDDDLALLGVATTGPADDLDALMRLLAAATLARPPSAMAPTTRAHITTALVARFGWSPLALTVAAELLEEDDTVPSRVTAANAARLWARVLAVWPDHPAARLVRARELRDERPDEALAAYRALVAAQPTSPLAHRDFIALALDHGLVDEALASAEALLALDRSPENIDAAVPALRAAGQARRADTLEEDRLRLDGAVGAGRRARRLLEAGRRDEAVAVWEQAGGCGGDPAAAEALIAHMAHQDLDSAWARAQAAVACWPRDPRFVAVEVELMRVREGDEAARARLLGQLPRARRHERIQDLAHVLGVPPPWRTRLDLADAVVASRRAAPKPPWPGHGMLALLDEMERFYDEDGSSWLFRHLVMELRSKEALDEFGEISPGGARVVRLRVLKPNGSVTEPERHSGLEDLSLPELSPGDIVELLTVRQDEAPRLGGFFETRALDHSPVPALTRGYVVSFPEGWDDARGLEVVQRGVAPERRVIIDAEGRRRVVVRLALTDVAPVSSEPFIAPVAETATVAGVAWGMGDSLWIRLRGHGVERAAQTGPWLEAAAHRIAGAGDPTQRFKRLFDFVVQRIEPVGQEDRAAAVLASGQGTRTALLLALARAEGLDAAPVALQLPGQPDPSTHDAASWSLLGVRVRTFGHEHIAVVDGYAVFDALPLAARGARVLDVSLGNSGATPEPLPVHLVDTHGAHVAVDFIVHPATRTMDGVVVITVPAAKADAARRGVRRATPEQLRQVLEAALADSLPGVRVLELQTPDLAQAGADLRLGARVEVPLPDSGDGAVRFEHLFSRGASGGLELTAPLTAYLATAERQQPMGVIADRELLELRVTLPERASFIEVPEPLELRAGPFQLRQHVAVTDGVLVWQREVATYTARVPVDAWPALRIGLAAMAVRTDARLGFVLASDEEPLGAGDAGVGTLGSGSATPVAGPAQLHSK